MGKESIKPLVSIIVITYNSAEYVCETLDSIYSQTYPNIEIIITDDCSVDKTVDVCTEWMSTHKDRDVVIKLITTKINTGVSANCNRGLNESTGEWIKPIAGDDILLPDAIDTYMHFINEKPECRIVFGREKWFSGSPNNYVIQDHQVAMEFFFFKNPWMSAKRQYHVLSRTFAGSGPASFLNADMVKRVGGFDERFPLREDYPLYIKLAKEGCKLFLLDKETVYYRRSENSITSLKDEKAIFVRSRVRYIKEDKYEYQYENLNYPWRMLLSFSLYLQNSIIDSGNSYESLKSVLFFYLYRLVDPFIWSARFYICLDKVMRVFM